MSRRLSVGIGVLRPAAGRSNAGTPSVGGTSPTDAHAAAAPPPAAAAVVAGASSKSSRSSMGRKSFGAAFSHLHDEDENASAALAGANLSSMYTTVIKMSAENVSRGVCGRGNGYEGMVAMSAM